MEHKDEGLLRSFQYCLSNWTTLMSAIQSNPNYAPQTDQFDRLIMITLDLFLDFKILQNPETLTTDQKTKLFDCFGVIQKFSLRDEVLRKVKMVSQTYFGFWTTDSIACGLLNGKIGKQMGSGNIDRSLKNYLLNEDPLVLETKLKKVEDLYKNSNKKEVYQIAVNFFESFKKVVITERLFQDKVTYNGLKIIVDNLLISLCHLKLYEHLNCMITCLPHMEKLRILANHQEQPKINNPTRYSVNKGFVVLEIIKSLLREEFNKPRKEQCLSKLNLYIQYLLDFAHADCFFVNKYLESVLMTSINMNVISEYYYLAANSIRDKLPSQHELLVLKLYITGLSFDLSYYQEMKFDKTLTEEDFKAAHKKIYLVLIVLSFLINDPIVKRQCVKVGNVFEPHNIGLCNKLNEFLANCYLCGEGFSLKQKKPLLDDLRLLLGNFDNEVKSNMKMDDRIHHNLPESFENFKYFNNNRRVQTKLAPIHYPGIEPGFKKVGDDDDEDDENSNSNSKSKLTNGTNRNVNVPGKYDEIHKKNKEFLKDISALFKTIRDPALNLVESKENKNQFNTQQIKDFYLNISAMCPDFIVKNGQLYFKLNKISAVDISMYKEFKEALLEEDLKRSQEMLHHDFSKYERNAYDFTPVKLDSAYESGKIDVWNLSCNSFTFYDVTNVLFNSILYKKAKFDETFRLINKNNDREVLPFKKVFNYMVYRGQPEFSRLTLLTTVTKNYSSMMDYNVESYDYQVNNMNKYKYTKKKIGAADEETPTPQEVLQDLPEPMEIVQVEREIVEKPPVIKPPRPRPESKKISRPQGCNHLVMIKKNLEIIQNSVALILNKKITFDFTNIEGTILNFVPKEELIRSEVSVIVTKRNIRIDQRNKTERVSIEVYGPERIESVVEAQLEEFHDVAYDERFEPYVKTTITLKKVSGSFVMLNALNGFRYDLDILENDAPKGKMKMGSTIAKIAQKTTPKRSKEREMKLMKMQSDIQNTIMGTSGGSIESLLGAIIKTEIKQEPSDIVPPSMPNYFQIKKEEPEVKSENLGFQNFPFQSNSCNLSQTSVSSSQSSISSSQTPVSLPQMSVSLAQSSQNSIGSPQTPVSLPQNPPLQFQGLFHQPYPSHLQQTNPNSLLKSPQSTSNTSSPSQQIQNLSPQRIPVQQSQSPGQIHRNLHSPATPQINQIISAITASPQMQKTIQNQIQQSVSSPIPFQQSQISSQIQQSSSQQNQVQQIQIQQNVMSPMSYQQSQISGQSTQIPTQSPIQQILTQSTSQQNMLSSMQYQQNLHSQITEKTTQNPAIHAQLQQQQYQPTQQNVSFPPHQHHSMLPGSSAFSPTQQRKQQQKQQQQHIPIHHQKPDLGNLEIPPMRETSVIKLSPNKAPPKIIAQYDLTTNEKDEFTPQTVETFSGSGTAVETPKFTDKIVIQENIVIIPEQEIRTIRTASSTDMDIEDELFASVLQVPEDFAEKERERLRKEEAMRQKAESERLLKLEQERIVAEKARILEEQEKAKAEQRRKEREELDRQEKEKQRIEKEKREKERQEKEKLEREKREKERQEKERIEKERREKEKLEKEKREKERQEKLERERKERQEREREKEKERKEREREKEKEREKREREREREREKSRNREREFEKSGSISKKVLNPLSFLHNKMKSSTRIKKSEIISHDSSAKLKLVRIMLKDFLAGSSRDEVQMNDQFVFSTKSQKYMKVHTNNDSDDSDNEPLSRRSSFHSSSERDNDQSMHPSTSTSSKNNKSRNVYYHVSFSFQSFLDNNCKKNSLLITNQNPNYANANELNKKKKKMKSRKKKSKIVNNAITNKNALNNSTNTKILTCTNNTNLVNDKILLKKFLNSVNLDKKSYSDLNPSNFKRNCKNSSNKKFQQQLTLLLTDPDDDNNFEEKKFRKADTLDHKEGEDLYNFSKKTLSMVPGMNSMEFFEILPSSANCEVVEIIHGVKATPTSTTATATNFNNDEDSEDSNDNKIKVDVDDFIISAEASTSQQQQQAQQAQQNNEKLDKTELMPHIQKIGRPIILNKYNEQKTSESSSFIQTSFGTVIKSAQNSNFTLSPSITAEKSNQQPNKNQTLINMLSQQLLIPTANNRHFIITSNKQDGQKITGNPTGQMIQIINTQTHATKVTTTTTTTTATQKSPITLTSSMNNFKGSGIVQFICKTDGKKIHLTPICSSPQKKEQPQKFVNTTPIILNNLKKVEGQNVISIVQQQKPEEKQPRSFYEENYAKFIQATSAGDKVVVSKSFAAIPTITTMSGKIQTLPKFNQAFGKTVFSITQAQAPEEKVTAGKIQTNVQQQQLQGNFLYARPYSIANGKLVSTNSNNVVLTTLRNKPNVRIISSIPETATIKNPTTIMTPVRISVPLISDNALQAKIIRPVIHLSGNQPSNLRQQFVITTPPRLNTTSTVVSPQNMKVESLLLTTNPQQSQQPQKIQEIQKSKNVDHSTLEQLREFDMVFEQVKEKSTTTPTSTPTPNLMSPTIVIKEEEPKICVKKQQKSVINNNNSVSSYCSTGLSSPALSVTSQSSTSSTGIKTEPNSPQKTTQSSGKNGQSSGKMKSSEKISGSAALKTTPKTQEDEQTAQRIYDILAEYAEQLRNSPDLNNKPAPRRRANPPTNPAAPSLKRKKMGKSSKHSELSPDVDRTSEEDSSCGMNSNSIGVPSTSSMNNSPRGPLDDPAELSFDNFYQDIIRKEENPPETLTSTSSTSSDKIPVARRLIFAPDPQYQNIDPEDFLVSNDQLSPAPKVKVEENKQTSAIPTAILMPGNYLVPMNVLKGGQQLTILSSNNGQKILAVPANQLSSPLLSSSSNNTAPMILQRYLNNSSTLNKSQEINQSRHSNDLNGNKSTIIRSSSISNLSNNGDGISKSLLKSAYLDEINSNILEKIETDLDTSDFTDMSSPFNGVGVNCDSLFLTDEKFDENDCEDDEEDDEDNKPLIAFQTDFAQKLSSTIECDSMMSDTNISTANANDDPIPKKKFKFVRQNISSSCSFVGASLNDEDIDD